MFSRRDPRPVLKAPQPPPPPPPPLPGGLPDSPQVELTKLKIRRLKEGFAGSERAVQIGDQMQSSASRVLGLAQRVREEIPYEVQMAMSELDSAIKDWTELRRRWAP